MGLNISLKFLVPVGVIILLFNLNFTYGLLGLAVYIIYIIYNGLPGMYFGRARVSYAKGDMEGAKAMLERCIRTQRAPTGALISYSYLLLRMGFTDKADEAVQELLKKELKPHEKIGVKTNYALILWKKGELDEAIKLLTELYDEGKNSTIYESLGYLLILKGDLDRAVEFNKEAYEYDSSNKIIMDNLGQSYYLKGDYISAKDIYEKLMDLSPEFPEPYYYYGGVLMELGKFEKALETVKKALDYDFTNMNTISKEEVLERVKYLESEAAITGGEENA
jgi:tetratricopeptide (TPR) repeat protein